MRLLSRFIPALVLLFYCFTTFCQEDVPQFTIQVGSFVNPKSTDFAHLAPLGFIYLKERPGSYKDVFIGGYSSEAQAGKVAQNLKMKGYDNAFVSKLNVEGGQPVTVIQLTTQTAGDKVNWEQLLEAGKLFLVLSDAQAKIVTGIFSDIAAAKAELPRIQSLGFKDAFIKNVNNALLHEVTDFETGGAVKKPLIPLDFSEKKKEEQKQTDVPTSYEDVAVVTPSPAPVEDKILTAKGATETSETKVPAKEPMEEAIKEPVKTAEKDAPKIIPVTAPKSNVPSIRPDVKRTSALELQKVLKAEGTYKGSLDGYYGKGTKAAYEQVLQSNRHLQKYQILVSQMPRPGTEISTGNRGFWDWNEVQILNLIAQDISAGSKSGVDLPQFTGLYLSPKALSAEEEKALLDWNSKLWTGIEGWATRDPLLGELSTALKISFFQTQALMEDYFMDKGFDPRASKGLALSALKALAGEKLERFI